MKNAESFRQRLLKAISAPIHNFDDEKFANKLNKGKLSKRELDKTLLELRSEMNKAAKLFDFERAAELRDLLFELQKEYNR